jgi:hypothetical protein
MYDIGRRVVITAPGFDEQVGHITERNYVTINGKRKAQYLVTYTTGLIDGSKITRDYLCGSDSLKPADYCCDSCNKWKSATQGRGQGQMVGGEYEELIWICWFCENVTYNDEKTYGVGWPD